MSADNMNQGSQANRTGNTLELTIIGTLSSKGFAVVPHKQWVKAPENYPGEILVRDVPFRSIYDHTGKTEFLLISQKHDLRIRIECKWQQVGGSVDEKFPYLYLNCIECAPENDVFIILDGGGAKPGAVKWLRDACEKKLYTSLHNRGKDIRAMTISEFMSWANKTLR